MRLKANIPEWSKQQFPEDTAKALLKRDGWTYDMTLALCLGFNSDFDWWKDEQLGNSHHLDVDCYELAETRLDAAIAHSALKCVELNGNRWLKPEEVVVWAKKREITNFPFEEGEWSLKELRTVPGLRSRAPKRERNDTLAEALSVACNSLLDSGEAINPRNAKKLLRQMIADGVIVNIRISANSVSFLSDTTMNFEPVNPKAFSERISRWKNKALEQNPDHPHAKNLLRRQKT